MYSIEAVYTGIPFNLTLEKFFGQLFGHFFILLNCHPGRGAARAPGRDGGQLPGADEAAASADEDRHAHPRPDDGVREGMGSSVNFV